MAKPRVTPEHKRKAQPESVLRYHDDGSYDWKCLGCHRIFTHQPPHRGRRKTLCRSCQNVKSYAKKVPPSERQRRSWSSEIYDPENVHRRLPFD